MEAAPKPVSLSDAGHAIVTVKTPQGNLTGDQMRGLAKLSEQSGDANLEEIFFRATGEPGPGAPAVPPPLPH